MSQNKQTLVLIVTRDCSPYLIPQLKVIIPMLDLLSPMQIYTSQKVIIQKPYYQNIVKSFESQIIVYPLEIIIEEIINKKQGKLRICVLGQEDVSWKTVLSCKRKSVVVDVIGKNAYLPFWTGGIHRTIKYNDNMISAFILDFGINTELRQTLSTSRSKKIDFSASCICHNKKIKQAYICSVCCAVYCEQTKKKGEPQCIKCKFEFDVVQV